MLQKFRTLNEQGQTLTSVMMAVAIGSVVALAMAQMFSQQTKAANYFEFQGKRENLHRSILGEFLGDPNNCACLLNTLPQFPSGSSPGQLTPATPITAVGVYKFVTPGVCATATIPVPFVDNSTAGIDGMKLIDVKLEKVQLVSGTDYQANLVLTLQSIKDVAGPQMIPLKIPVAVSTVPGTPGNVKVASCSVSGNGPIGSCPSPQVSQGYDASGTIICRDPTAGVCPAPQAATGYDSAGHVICAYPTPAPAASCAAGTLLTGYDSNGNAVCDVPRYQ